MLKKPLICIAIALLVSACIQENPALVNPPGRTESVRVRFVNLAQDKQTRALDISGTTKTELTQWGNSSASVRPPADSALFNIYRNSIKEYELEQLVKFLRNTRYTFFGVPSKECLANPPCTVDTLIFMRTTTALPENNFEFLLKMINLFPDTNSTFSVRMGCPSGNVLFANINYLQSSMNPLNLRAEKIGLSLIRQNRATGTTVEEFINIYEAEFTARTQYILVIADDGNGNPVMKLLNEDDESSNALADMAVINERIAYMRIINLASSNIDIDFNGSLIAASIPNDQITDYKQISVCNTVDMDSITTLINGSRVNMLKSSIELLKRYSIVVLDSGNVVGGEILLVSPIKLQEDITGKGIVRVLHASKNYQAITVSLGARTEPDVGKFPNGYSSGTILAADISQGKLSEPLALYPGAAPLSIFTSSQPAKLLYSAKGIFEADKSYLLIISEDIDGKTKISIVEDELENTDVTFMEEGIFVQVVNAVSDADFITIEVISSKAPEQIVKGAKVSETNSLATVVDRGTIEVRVNGATHSIDAEINDRVMFIASGSGNNPKIFANKFTALPINENSALRFRFINATEDIPFVYLKRNVSEQFFFESVEQYHFSSYATETREQKVTFFFYDDEGLPYVNRLSDVLFTLGKSYSVIIAGKKAPGCLGRLDTKRPWEEPDCYFIIIQQEF